MKKFLLTTVFSVFAAVLTAAEAVIVPTTAVLPFEVRTRAGEQNAEGKSIAELIGQALLENGSADLVERAELDKAMDELLLSATGLTDKNSQLKLGKLIGAKIIITGSMFRSGEKNFIVAKIIGTETSRVTGCSVSGNGDFAGMVSELTPKITKLLEFQSARLLPAVQDSETVYDVLKKQIRGNQRKVFVSMKEDIQVSVPDPAAETELKKLLLRLDFQIVKSESDADFVIRGEAVAANAGNFKKFTSAAARIEMTVSGKDQKLLAAGTKKETLAGAAYIIAAKDAIAQGTLNLAAELFSVMK